MQKKKAVKVAVSVFLVLLSVTTVLAAEKGFEAFFKKFRLAVHNKDRQVVRAMLSPDIVYTFGRGWPGDRRDGAIKTWDERKAWPQISAALDQGFEPFEGGYISPSVAAHRAKKLRIVFMRSKKGEWQVKICLSGD